MSLRRSALLATFALILAPAAAWAQPVITSLSKDVLPRSGRVAIAGSGFGTEGLVLVAGLQAWVSTWTDTRIVAYVPEQAALGAATLLVEVGGQPSNEMPLTVTNRRSDGRILWTFEFDTPYIYYRPARAPDGTLYVHGYSVDEGGDGKVFAVSADGALLWIQEVYGTPYVPPSAGPDGAAYVGSVNWLYRISPAGTIDWAFEGFNIHSSAAFGPDGTVYAGFEQAPEAVALDPITGELLWSSSPGLSAFGTCCNETRLGRSTPGGPLDRFFIWWDLLAGFSLDGDHLFFSTVPGPDEHEVAVGFDGTLYAPSNFASELAAISPIDGSVYWTASSPWLAKVSEVEIGPDDTLYFISDFSYIDAFDPQTRTSIWHRDVNHYLQRPSVTPDGRILLTSGGGTCNDPQGCTISFIKAFETTNGDELWHIDLNETWDPECRDVTGDHARVSPDSRRAYFTGFVQGDCDFGDERSLIWAIDLAGEDIFSDGFESGDTSGWSPTQAPAGR